MKKLLITALIASLAISALAQTVYYPDNDRHFGTVSVSEIKNAIHDLEYNTVSSVNEISGAVAITGGDNVTVTKTNDTIYITAEQSEFEQVQSDWEEDDTTDPAYIANKPTIPTVPTDVSAFNNDAGYITASDIPDIPDSTSDLTNDSGFITAGDIPAQVNADWEEDDTEDPAYIANKPEIISSTIVSNVAHYIVNEMAANGWEVDGTYYKLVVQPFTPPPPAESTLVFTGSRGTVVTNITTIGGYENVSELRSVSLGTNVTTIDSVAFNNCVYLNSVTIPDSVTSIGGSAFYGCKRLKDITIPGSVTFLSSQMFRESGLTNVTISSGVESIGPSVFMECTNLTSIVVPDSVKNIGNYAFSACSGLTDVTIGSSVTNLDLSAFSECSKLTNVVIPSSTVNVSNYAFQNCSSLTSITIPASVAKIGPATFSGCSNLANIIMSDRTTSEVQEMNNYSWGLPFGCVITCSDGTITIP